MRSALLSFTIALTLAGTASADKLQETFDRTVDVRSGASISLENTNGRIAVTSWDQAKVRIHAIKKADSREVMDKLSVDVRGGGDSLSIVSRMPNKDGSGILDMLFGNGGNASIEYEITVPRAADLKIENTNGSISAADIVGKIELGTTNGRIEAFRCSGTLSASTTNGSIRAELLQVTTGKSMEFETTNGSIAVTVPPSFAANVDADTTNGSIRTDLPVTTRSFSRRELRGTLNGGGPSLSLHTTNGSIEIRSNAAVTR
jgi:hypothetical protein